MTATIQDAPDVEGALQDYLRQHALVTAHVSTRSFLAVTTPSFPYVLITRIGGPEGVAGDVALVQLDVYGEVKALLATDNARRAVRGALADLTEAPFTADGKGRLLGAQVRDDRRFPDQGQDGTAIGERPRYIITASVYCVAAPA